jgi:hypothetical protein
MLTNYLRANFFVGKVSASKVPVEVESWFASADASCIVERYKIPNRSLIKMLCNL